jgi:hypothetical protein
MRLLRCDGHLWRDILLFKPAGAKADEMKGSA